MNDYSHDYEHEPGSGAERVEELRRSMRGWAAQGVSWNTKPGAKPKRRRRKEATRRRSPR